MLRDRASVRDGLLTLPHGTQYRLLVLPELETMRPELLTKIARLVKDGAVVLGPCPDRSPSLQGQPGADLLVRALASEMWAEVDGVTRKSRRYGKGAVLSGMSMEEALAYVDCPPDLKTDCRDIVYGHRRVGETDIYFVANQSAVRLRSRPVFALGGFDRSCGFPFRVRAAASRVYGFGQERFGSVEAGALRKRVRRFP